MTLEQNEQLLYSSYANHFEHTVRMTGKLFVTNMRLFFTTHPLNFKQYELSIPFENIVSVTLRNNLKFLSHGFELELKNGHVHQFVVWRRRHWVGLISKQLKSA